MSIWNAARTTAAALALLLAVPSLSQAVPMSGDLFMGNPSAGATRQAYKVNTSIATTGTGTGRTIMMPAGIWDMSGLNQRIFPGFPSVAQNTEVFSTTHAAVTFGPGLGADATDWCPQITGCGGFGNATVASGQGRIVVTPGANTFGGAFRLLRHLRLGSGAWFVFNPGTTPTKLVGFNANLRGVTVTGTSNGFPTATVNTPSSPWSAGITNGLEVTDVNPFNQIWAGNLLGPSGSIQTLGTFVSTSTGFDPPDGFATGFKMTTGTIMGSDATPPASVSTITNPSGTVTNTTPNGGTSTIMTPTTMTIPLAPFTFTSMGYDNRTAGGLGNIQLVGGAVAYAGFTGNVFFRVTRLRMAVPEPASALALGAGIAGFAVLAGIRRRKQA